MKSCEKYISSVVIQPKVVVKQKIVKTEDSHRNSGAKIDVKTDGIKKVVVHPKIVKIVEKTDPKLDSSSKNTQNGSPSDPKLENTKKAKTENSNTKSTETPSPPIKQPNKEMHRPENVVMLFNNRLKKLEDELTVTTAYLEQLSNSYMVQMDGIRAVHNRTLIRLTNHIETTTQNITTLSKQMQIHSLKMEKEFEKLGRQSFWMKNRLDRFQIEKRRNSSKFDMKKIERWLSIIQERIGESVSNKMSTDMQEQLIKYDKFNFEKILQHINYNDILVILLLSQFILNIFLKFLSWCFGKIASSCLVVMSFPVKAIRKRRKTADYSSKTNSVVSKIRNLSHRSSSGRKSLKLSKSLPKIHIANSQFNEDSQRIDQVDLDKLMLILTRIERLERSMVVRKRAEDSFSDQLGALRVISRSEPGKELAKISQEISHRTILRKQNGEETTQDEMTLDEDIFENSECDSDTSCRSRSISISNSVSGQSITKSAVSNAGGGGDTTVIKTTNYFNKFNPWQNQNIQSAVQNSVTNTQNNVPDGQNNVLNTQNIVLNTQNNVQHNLQHNLQNQNPNSPPHNSLKLLDSTSQCSVLSKSSNKSKSSSRSKNSTNRNRKNKNKNKK